MSHIPFAYYHLSGKRNYYGLPILVIKHSLQQLTCARDPTISKNMFKIIYISEGQLQSYELDSKVKQDLNPNFKMILKLT